MARRAAIPESINPATGRLSCRRTGRILALAFALAAVACEPEAEKPPTALPPDQAVLTPALFSDLPGWAGDRHAEAVPAFLRSCARFQTIPVDRPLGLAMSGGTIADVLPACSAAAELPAGDDGAARRFFESWFRPYLVANNDSAEGLFTGYYEIELRGALESDATYDVPVYRKPRDQVAVDLGEFDPALAGKSLIGRIEGGRLKPYYPRRAIQQGALDGRGLELVWLDDPLDAFMLHVQGSGRVRLSDGRTTRIGFAGHNGHDYRSIGRELIRRGALEAHEASWQGIRQWIESNPEEAADLLAVNRRYIFFDEIIGDGPVGAQGVALTAGRSLAVDTRYVPLGLPMWLDTLQPGQAASPLQRLVVAQDTGAAIKGPVRGDYFWGTGDAALEYAGRMKHQGRYYLLLPRRLANRLAAS
ncbi:MAG: MltA domain-containing protein [Alphaproteobacteria bacterium]|nr:MltA domain-containing protein [Alphaproteobacteria bacterium]